MTDRPILFSAPMVRALLAGTKTQMRRVIRPRHNPNRPSLFDGTWSDSYVLDPDNQKWRDDAYPWRVGDRLWVREAWRTERTFDEVRPRDLPIFELPGLPIFYEANDNGQTSTWGNPWGEKRRPSMFMLRWASRLTLVVTGVKVERLQDISEEDAQAEGCDGGSLCVPVFRDLWKSINGPGSWEANPWVVALTFSVHKQNIDAMKEAA